ncbi:hypothetical protein [Rhodococcus marinonascens]|uniref:hypothetical protein n=1 Tax=Rhodococcus marinonascens TaxID=38311 RepID=UPI0009325CA1|nr:hypothetical protein [Rhodococcus marinonascens]
MDDIESTQDNDRTGTRRGPSVIMLLSGLAALFVSGWALAGRSFAVALEDNVEFRWVFVVVAVLVGVVLVFAPSRRK